MRIVTTTRKLFDNASLVNPYAKAIAQLGLLILLSAILSALMPVYAAASNPVSALFRTANDPVIGNPKGNITVVEFFDYECGHCQTMADTIAVVMRTKPNVRFVFKETPLDGDMSEYATRAALAANKQGKYFQFSRALLNSNRRLTKQRILDIAENTGLNIERLTKDMQDSSISNTIKNNYQLWRKLRLRGTPTFFIGRTNATSLDQVKYFLGELSQSELQSAIENVR